MGLIHIFVLFIRGIFRSRIELAAENLELRQQLVALLEKVKRPCLRERDRMFWAILFRPWSGTTRS
jgi:hypothetical protein